MTGLLRVFAYWLAGSVAAIVIGLVLHLPDSLWGALAFVLPTACGLFAIYRNDNGSIGP